MARSFASPRRQSKQSVTSADVLHKRQPDAHGRTSRAVGARRDLETPTKLLGALAHAHDAHAGASTAGDVLEQGLRDAVAPIFDLQHEHTGVTPQPDARSLAAGVPVDVVQ